MNWNPNMVLLMDILNPSAFSRCENPSISLRESKKKKNFSRFSHISNSFNGVAYSTQKKGNIRLTVSASSTLKTDVKEKKNCAHHTNFFLPFYLSTLLCSFPNNVHGHYIWDKSELLTSLKRKTNNTVCNFQWDWNWCFSGWFHIILSERSKEGFTVCLKQY